MEGEGGRAEQRGRGRGRKREKEMASAAGATAMTCVMCRSRGAEFSPWAALEQHTARHPLACAGMCRSRVRPLGPNGSEGSRLFDRLCASCDGVNGATASITVWRIACVTMYALYNIRLNGAIASITLWRITCVMRLV
jgi:hypothetical protein